MALPSTSVWEVRATGSDTNGGGYNPSRAGAGTDRSQQDAAYLSGTNLTIHASTSTLVLPDGHTPVSDDVGNYIHITAGTGFTTGVYEITAINSGYWQLDRNPAAVGTSGGTWNMGGAMASIGQVFSVAPNSGNQTVWLKSGTYSITSASTNVAGGCVLFGQQIHIEGYETTRGDLGTRPIIQASGISSFIVLNLSSSRTVLRNIEIDCAGLTSSRGLLIRGSVYRVKISNATNGGFVENTGTTWIACEAVGCSIGAAFQGGKSVIDCVARDGTSTGFLYSASTVSYHRCLSYNNSGASSYGFAASGTTVECQFNNCVAYDNGGDGFRPVSEGNTFINCIAESNGGYGFFTNGSLGLLTFVNCATYNNTSGGIQSLSGRGTAAYNHIAGSTSFFVDAAGGNFALNNVAGGGAECRQAGQNPSGHDGYLDVGAIQHQSDFTDEEIAEAVWTYTNRTLTA